MRKKGAFIDGIVALDAVVFMWMNTLFDHCLKCSWSKNWCELFTLICSLPCGQQVKKSVFDHGAYSQSPFFEVLTMRWAYILYWGQRDKCQFIYMRTAVILGYYSKPPHVHLGVTSAVLVSWANLNQRLDVIRTLAAQNYTWAYAKPPHVHLGVTSAVLVDWANVGLEITQKSSFIGDFVES